MIKLIYRGINYQSQQPNTQLPQAEKIYSLAPSDKCDANKIQNFERLISIKPMHYYTYRGVSYTKTVVADLYRNTLLDIDRQ